MKLSGPVKEYKQRTPTGKVRVLIKQLFRKANQPNPSGAAILQGFRIALRFPVWYPYRAACARGRCSFHCQIGRKALYTEFDFPR